VNASRERDPPIHESFTGGPYVQAARGNSMISIVNGYVCTTSCEVASAKQGKDPSAPPGSPSGVSGKNKSSAFDNRPASILDGSLAKTVALMPADNAQQSRVDRTA